MSNIKDNKDVIMTSISNFILNQYKNDSTTKDQIIKDILVSAGFIIDGSEPIHIEDDKGRNRIIYWQYKKSKKPKINDKRNNENPNNYLLLYQESPQNKYPEIDDDDDDDDDSLLRDIKLEQKFKPKSEESQQELKNLEFFTDEHLK